MPTAAPTRTPASGDGREDSSRFDRRLGELLHQATGVICEKGYEAASMRDISRATGMSLAGMYYYFQSKERLLYLIQKHTFTSVVERLRERLAEVRDPVERVRVFIENHLEYFIENREAMKVLSHEAEVLKNGPGAEIAAIKREYFRICVGLLDGVKAQHGVEFSSRTATLGLFGMMNWLYTWYNPRLDAGSGELARQMGDIFLHGVLSGTRSSVSRRETGVGSRPQKRSSKRQA